MNAPEDKAPRIFVGGLGDAVILAPVTDGGADQVSRKEAMGWRAATSGIAGIGAAAGLCFWHPGLTLVPVCVGPGVLVHILGDELTLHGCPLLWPLTGHDFHLLPRPLRISTGVSGLFICT